MFNWKKMTTAAVVVVFIVSNMLLVRACIQYSTGKTEYRELVEVAEKVVAGSASQGVLKDMEVENYLLSKNTDYVGWIQIEGTEINYPIVREREDDYYLTHTFSGEENPCGTIFMDRKCSFSQGGNTILYGHNMKDGSMFGSLKKFKKAEYVKEHDTIRVHVGGKDYVFRVFACVIAQGGDSPAYTCTFGSVEEQLAFLDEMRQESLVAVEYVPQPADMFLTLSTCTGPGGRDRLLVMAAMPRTDM